MKETITIGLVGAGGMGTVHRSNYAHIGGCRVAAVCGAGAQDEAKAKEWGVPLYRSVDDMLDSEEIDAVDVCVPTFLHKQFALAAISRGKHVIVEKPAALNLDDTKEIFGAAEKAGVNVYVGQVLRFYPASRILKELVESGEYGRVLDASFERLSACPRWAQGGWLFDKQKSGHLPFDLHIHDLDLIVSLFGKPDSFTYTCCGNADKDYKEHYRFLYKFGDLSVAAEAAWYNADIPFTAGFRVYFENAVLINDGQRLVAYQFDKEPRVFDTEEKILIPTGINLPPTGVFLEELEHFTDCIRRGVPSDRIKKEQLLAVMEVLTEVTNA